jgi:hypothetical protein
MKRNLIKPIASIASLLALSTAFAQLQVAVVWTAATSAELAQAS